MLTPSIEDIMRRVTSNKEDAQGFKQERDRRYINATFLTTN